MKKFNFLFLSLWIASPILSQNPTAVWTQTAHPDLLAVNGVAFSSDGTKIISGTDCHPSKVRVYKASNGSIDWDYTAANSFYCLMGINFSSNGKYFAAVEEMGNILVFNNSLNPPVLSNTIAMGTQYAFSIDFAPNNGKILVGGANGKLQTYLLNGLLELDLNAHSAWVTAVNYSSDNSKIASGGSDAVIKIWDTTGVLLHTLNGHNDDISALRFTKNNQYLISVSLDDQIKVWDANNGALIQTISPQGGDIFGLDISNDNKHFVTVSYDKKVRIYNLNTFELEYTFGSTNSGLPRCVAWSPTNLSKIAVGYSGSRIIMYDVTFNPVSVEFLNKGSELISVFPVPFDEFLTINWTDFNVKSIEITSTNGAIVQQFEVKPNQQVLTISGNVFEKNETYLVILKTNSNKQWIKKVIKK